MQRKAVGFFARLMDSSTFIASYFPLPADSCSVPVSRASDEAKPGTGLVYLSLDDPCLVLGEGTKFTTEFAPKMQIMLPKSVNSAVAEVVEVISDTELRIKKEFGGDSGKGTTRIREKIGEARDNGINGLAFKVLPFINQQEMYRGVYQKLKEGGCIGIFPEGKPPAHQPHCGVSLNC
jgi:glycerol-3-phosphate O-acyltransferase/dihydroxyacetone phosphate acyltransferase